jgi:hypothetical protein
MATFLLNNNASSTLLDGINGVIDLIVVQVADAVKFPSISGNEYFMITLEDTSQSPVLREVCKVTATASNTFTVLRAQEGFNPQTFSAGATVSNRITAGTILALYEATGEATQYYLGPLASDPVVTPTGGPLVTGMLYFNTTTSVLKEYNGTLWSVISGGSGTIAGSAYLGDFSSPPTERPSSAGGGALQEGDLYYDLVLIGLYERHDGAWVSAGSTTITGTTTFIGNVVMDESLSVVGTTTLMGQTNTADQTVTGDETISGTLSVGTSEVPGAMYLDGQLLVTAADLSGTSTSQGWPDGGQEYWGEAQTGSGGTVYVAFPDPFENALTNINVTVIASGAGTPAANFAVVYNRSVDGFSVATFAGGTGGINGPVAFFWRARGS